MTAGLSMGVSGGRDPIQLSYGQVTLSAETVLDVGSADDCFDPTIREQIGIATVSVRVASTSNPTSGIGGAVTQVDEPDSNRPMRYGHTASARTPKS